MTSDAVRRLRWDDGPDEEVESGGTGDPPVEDQSSEDETDDEYDLCRVSDPTCEACQ